MPRRQPSPRDFYAQPSVPVGLDQAPQDWYASVMAERAQAVQGFQDRIDAREAQTQANRQFQQKRADRREETDLQLQNQAEGRAFQAARQEDAQAFAAQQQQARFGFRQQALNRAQQEQQLRISKDVATIEHGARTGWTEFQTHSATENLVKQHGFGAVMEAQGGAQLLGREQEWNSHKEQAQQNFAAQYTGGDRKYVRWDDRTGQPDYNGHALQFDQAQAEMRAKLEAPQAAKTKAFLSALTGTAPKRSDFKDVTGRINEVAYGRAQQQYASTIIKAHGAAGDPDKLQAMLEQQTGLTATNPVAQLEAEVASSPGVESLQSSRPMAPNFVQQQVNAGQLQPGIYIDPQGRRYRVRKDQ